jgi:hypothetical protein
MVVNIKAMRIRATDEMLNRYVPKTGIDMRRDPVEGDPNLWDILLKTSDQSSEPSERLHLEDLEHECEKFKIISERAKDLTLYVKSFGNIERMIFEGKEDDPKIDGIDKVRDDSEVMGTYEDGKKQIRWVDSSS